MSTRNRGRKRRQRVAVRYMKCREDCQLYALIETTPAGAIGRERAAPATEEKLSFPAIDRMAIRRDWPTANWKKPIVVDRLIKHIEHPDTSAREKIATVRALWIGDTRERDRKTRAN